MDDEEKKRMMEKGLKKMRERFENRLKRFKEFNKPEMILRRLLHQKIGVMNHE